MKFLGFIGGSLVAQAFLSLYITLEISLFVFLLMGGTWLIMEAFGKYNG